MFRVIFSMCIFRLAQIRVVSYRVIKISAIFYTYLFDTKRVKHGRMLSAHTSQFDLAIWEISSGVKSCEEKRTSVVVLIAVVVGGGETCKNCLWNNKLFIRTAFLLFFSSVRLYFDSVCLYLHFGDTFINMPILLLASHLKHLVIL